MKRTLILIASIAFILFAALWTYIQSDEFAVRIRPLVVREIQRAIGTDAQVGWVKANLFPLFLEVRDIRIPSARSPEAIAIRKINFYLNPVPLLWKTVSVPSVVVLEPRIAAERSRDGRIDLLELMQKMIANLERNRSPGPPSVAVRVGTISIRNGSIRFHDDASGAAVAASRLALRARLDLASDHADVRLTNAAVSVRTPGRDEITAKLHAVAAYDGGTVALAAFDLQSPAGRLEASGTFGMGADAPLNVVLSVHAGQGSVRSLTGLMKRKTQQGLLVDAELRLRGTLTAPQLEGSTRFSGISMPGFGIREGNLRFSYRNGAGTASGENWTLSRGDQQATIDAVELEAGYRAGRIDVIRANTRSENASVSASGWVGIEEGYHLALNVALSGVPPVLKLFTTVDLSGAATFAGTMTGPLTAPELSGTLTAEPLTVRGVPFRSVSGLIVWRGVTLSVTDADIQHDSSRYRFDGSVTFLDSGPRYDARLRVIRSDVVSIVALFYQRIPLLLNASGELVFTGTTQEFSGRGTLTLGPGTAYGESFRSGKVTAELSSSRVTFPEVVLEKEGAELSGSGWIGFDGTYGAEITGRGDDLAAVDRLQPLPLSGPYSAEIRSSGTFSAPLVHAEARSPSLRYGEVPLGASVCTIEIAEGSLAATATVTNRGGAAVRAKGRMALKQPFGWTAAVEVQGQDVDLSSYAAENEYLGRAKLSVEGSVQLQGERIALDAVSGSLRLSKLALSLGEYGFENEGELALRIDGGRITIGSMTLTGKGTRLSVTGSSGWGAGLEVTCIGETDVSLVRALSRAVEHADGTASVRLNIRDAWSAPEVSGELVLHNGLLKIRDVPQRFTGLNGSIVFDRQRIISEGITGEVGGGTITFSGSAALQRLSLGAFSTRTVIENVTVRYPPGLTANLGGTLFYDGDRESQTLAGEVNIRKARYERRVDWKSMLVDFSKKFMPQKKAELGWIGETRLNVRFTGKESILFENNLAKVPMEVDMLLSGTVNQVQVLGRIEARQGEGDFRRKIFRIPYASVDFADPARINPVLDVQAETRVRDYQIRMGVSGTADRAVVTFLSDPPLSDSDILAMLAVGRTSEELKGKGADVGSSEAISFATGQFQDFLESRARSLIGLDRFQIDPYMNRYDTTVPRVTVGKEMVQDKVYMSYSSNIGGTVPEQNVRLEYILNRNVSLLGEYDELGQIGADVKFRFEFR